jgi:hypothetical protein
MFTTVSSGNPLSLSFCGRRFESRFSHARDAARTLPQQWGVDGGTVEMEMRFYLSALKEAEIKFSDHLVLRQRAPKGSGTRKRGTGKAADTREEDTEIEIPDGTFEVSFSVLGITGSAVLPEDLSPEQWEPISNYVKMVLGYRQQAQKAGA